MVWHDLLHLLFRHSPELAEGLRPPPQAADVGALEAKLGVMLPQDVRQILKQHDGQHVGGRILFGLVQMKLADIARYRSTNDVFFVGEDVDPRIQSDPSSRVFLPIFTDDTGNYLGVDCRPSDQGQPFQVVVFGADMDEPHVIASSLGALFDHLADEIKVGNVEVVQEHGYPVMKFKDASETLLKDIYLQ